MFGNFNFFKNFTTFSSEKCNVYTCCRQFENVMHFNVDNYCLEETIALANE